MQDTLLKGALLVGLTLSAKSAPPLPEVKVVSTYRSCKIDQHEDGTWTAKGVSVFNGEELGSPEYLRIKHPLSAIDAMKSCGEWIEHRKTGWEHFKVPKQRRTKQ